MGKGFSRLSLHWPVTEGRAPWSVNSPAPGSSHHESWALPHGQGMEVGTLHVSGNPVWLGCKVGDDEEERAPKGILKEMKKEDWPKLSFQVGPWAALHAQQRSEVKGGSLRQTGDGQEP